MRGFLPAIVMVLLVVISLALILAISLGIGWLLTLLLPFSLFEGTLLGMIAAVASGALWYAIFRAALLDQEEEQEEENGYEAPEIPGSRFWRRPAQRTWENWFRYVLANSIYEDLATSPRWASSMGERQQQELSIRLADAALAALRARASYARRLRVSREMLRQRMEQAGQEPDDVELLDLAVAAVNLELGHLEPELRRVAREQLWDAPAEVR